MRRIFLWINFVLASLIVLLVFAQAYFITAYVTGAGQDALDTHGFIGFAIIHPAELLVFLTAFGAWPRAWSGSASRSSSSSSARCRSSWRRPTRTRERLGARLPRPARARRRRDGGRDRASRHARPRAQAVFAFARRWHRYRTPSIAAVTASASPNARRSAFQGSSSNVLPKK